MNASLNSKSARSSTLLIRWLCSGAVALGAASVAVAQDYPRAAEVNNYRIARAADWNLSSAEGHCQLRVFVDDRATVSLRGDQVIVNTRSGRTSYDQGSVCNQPLPFHEVADFRVSARQGRGSITDVRAPNRFNDFTGSVSIHDPQNNGDLYVIDVAWVNAGSVARPLASADAPYLDETRACQERVRDEFLSRNSNDAYLEFTTVPRREDAGAARERIAGEAWARNRVDSRPVRYECMLNTRTNRVIASSYELRSTTTALR